MNALLFVLVLSLVSVSFAIPPKSHVRPSRENPIIVENGATISHTADGIAAKDPNGRVTYHPQAQPSFQKRDQYINPGLVTSLWSKGTAYSYFKADFFVPPVPATTSDGQELFFYNALENNAETEILMTTLQWNYNITNKWSVACWYGYTSGSSNVFVASRSYAVNPGDLIKGIIQLSGSTWYLYVYVNYVEIVSFSISTSTISSTLDWAYLGLEEYGVNHCTDYPPSEYITFSYIQLTDGQTSVTPSWEGYPYAGYTCPGSYSLTGPKLTWAV